MVLPLAGYVRVSRVGARDLTDGFISPDIQERSLLDWGERSNTPIVMLPHELNVSGGTMDRPIFNQIMKGIKDGTYGGFAVYKLDRFARTLLGAISTLETLGEYTATFTSTTEPQLDYTTPAGRAFVQQLFVFAEFTRATLKESWYDTQKHAIGKGIHISPNGFLGYDVGAGRRLVPNKQAEIVKEVFRRRAELSASWGSVADWLQEVAPKDDTVWTPQSVQRLCSKRVYRGEASRYVTQDVDGRGPIVNSDAHEALVSEDVWRSAQMNPSVSIGGNNGKPLPLLSGLVRCAGCRYSMSLGYGPRGERMYRCRKRHASGTCPTPAQVMSDHLESYVEEIVLTEIDGIARLVPDSSDRDRIVSELDQARIDLDDFRRDLAARRKLGSEWHDWLDTYLAPVRNLETELERVDQQLRVARNGLTRDFYRGLPDEDRREVLGGFIDTIMVRRSRGRGRNVDPIERRVRVLWTGQAPDDLPKRRVVNEIIAFEFKHDIEPRIVPTEDAS